MDAVVEFNRRSKDAFSVLDEHEKGYQEFLKTSELVKRSRDLLFFDLIKEHSSSFKFELVKSANDLVGFDPFEEHNSRKRKNPDSEEPTPESATSRKTKKCFIRDPSKWTEYSLEDVTEEQMSDEACRRAAFEFLRSRGVEQDIVEEKGEVDDKIVFQVKKNQETKKDKKVRFPNPKRLSFVD